MKRHSRIRKTMIVLAAIITALLIISSIVWFIMFTSNDRSVITSSYRAMNYNGAERGYLITEPNEITADSRIIVGIHGFGDSARKFAYYTALHNSATQNDVVIYPNAIKPSEGQRPGWNAGFCCGSGWDQGVDDAGYIVNLVESVKSERGIKSEGFYAVGFSNGGFMVQKLAADYPGKVQAAAVMSGSIGTKKNALSPKSPLPILLMHGRQDKTVSFSGGVTGGDPDFSWLSFSETERVWKENNGSQSPISTIIYPETGHSWKGWRIANFWHSRTEASEESIKFFDNLD